MRRFLQRNKWITVLVGCLLLFATSGLSISRMTCLLGGHSELSIGKVGDCCPMEEDTDGPSVQAECCAITQAALDRVHGVQPNSLHLDPFFLEEAVVVVREWSLPGVLPVRRRLGGPPPLTAPERLAHLGVLLV